MDAVIRFCFSNVAPEELNEEEYIKLFSQAKYVIEYANILQTKQVMGTLNGR